jgi:LAO/AO transport system kinase
MEDVALDPGVYIRSLATRGSLGGLSAATREVCDVLDAFGIDRVLIETVGVGQSELDVARTADTSLVILVPESGDSIQTLKAGLMEIADVFAVNKAGPARCGPAAHRDRADARHAPGAAATQSSGHHGVDLSRNNLARQVREAAQQDATRGHPRASHDRLEGQGIAELAEALDRHFRYLESSGQLRPRGAPAARARGGRRGTKTRQRLWADARRPPGSRHGSRSWSRERRRRSRSPTRCWRAAPTC